MDPSTAIAWYEQAAKEGWADSFAALGVIYHQGEIAPQDYEKARHWYEKAAVQDNPRALNNLGILYTEALGVAQNYEKAAHYYQRSADLGFPQAMTNLGTMYDNGFGVPQSDETAIYYYQKATEKSRKSRATIALPNAEDMNKYLTAINSDLSVLKQRATGGEPVAQYILGNLYLKGRGVPQDYVLAYQWLNLSGDNQLRNELAERMTKSQLNEAQELSRNWLNQHSR